MEKKMILICALSIVSLILFISFCLNHMATAAFIASVPTVVLNGYVIFYGCYKDGIDEDDE